MAWTPISNAVIQYAKDAAGTSASGYYLKFYASGTSTPFSMASASDGSGLLAKCQLNSLGYPINGSGDVFIPHVDQDYRIVLYPTSADADANTFANAVFDVDGVKQQIINTSDTFVKVLDLSATSSSVAIAGYEAAILKPFDTVGDMLSGITSAHNGKRVYWLGYHSASDGGDGWGIVRTGTHTDDGGRILSAGASLYVEQNLNGDKISVKKFGAKGDNDQTTQSVSYTSDSISITTQTTDGERINKLIRYLRSLGKGHIFFPSGTYRIYSYLEQLDFPCTIEGESPDITIIKSCDASPTNANGFGIFVSNPTTNTGTTVFKDLTLDGNIDVRANPTLEWRCHNLAILRQSRIVLENVRSINGALDCLYIAHENDNLNCTLKATNCEFRRSWRNSVSCVAGWYQTFTNCVFAEGGYGNLGHAPKSCLDIEPNIASMPIENLLFSNCLFIDAKSYLVVCSRGQGKFSNCNFVTSEGEATGLTGPYVSYTANGQYEFTGCKFRGDSTYAQQRVRVDGNGETSKWLNTSYTKFSDCEFEYCGMQNGGERLDMSDCSFTNSLYPVVMEGLGVFSYHKININNVTLTNVIDKGGLGWQLSSFLLKTSIKGPVLIDGLRCEIDTNLLSKLPSFTITGGQQFGIKLQLTNLQTDAYAIVKNCYSAGYYRKLPTFTGDTLSPSNFSDWSGTIPADTSGQSTGAATAYYHSNLQYGDFA